MKPILHLLTSIVFVIMAFVLFGLFFVPALIFAFINSFFNKQIGSGIYSVSEWLRKIVFSIDQTANVFASGFFNATLIRREQGGYLFGNPDETISSVLGKNQREETLSKVGKLVVYILDRIDKDHVRNSIGY